MKILTLAIPTKISINATTVLSLLGSLQAIKTYIVKLEILPGKSNIDQSRSIMLTKWYDSSGDDDIFMFIDSDQTFTKDDIENVVKLDGDVNVGVYVNRANLPTCFPKNRELFFMKKDDELLYGATGFMAIRRPILKKVIDYLKIENRMNTEPRYWIDNHHQNIIPFFTQRLIDAEVNNDSIKKQWLGEDYGFCWLVRQCGGTIKGHLSSTIGHDINDVKFFDHVKNIPDEWDDKSIVYFTGSSRLQWGPADIKTKGLGGSETAVARLSNEWVKAGYNVTVYGNCKEGNHDGVVYKHYSRFKPVDKFNIIILWRGFGMGVLKHVNNYNKLYIDLHDNPSQSYNILYEQKKKIDKIFVKSKFQRDLLDKSIHNKIHVLENGINVDILDEAIAKNIVRNPKKLLYTSSYDRGLVEMLKYGFPYIKKHVPDAEFHICYGMELIRDKKLKKELTRLLKQDGVVDHGQMGQEELADLRMTCNILYYVGNWPEIDCLSVKEALYAGLHVVTAHQNVFKERSQYFKTIYGDVSTQAGQEKAAQYVVDLINGKNNESYPKYPIKNWETVATKWINIFKQDKVKYGLFKKVDNLFVKKDHIGENFDKLMKQFILQDCNVNKFKVFNKPPEEQVQIKDNPHFKNLEKKDVINYMSNLSIWNNAISTECKHVCILDDSIDIDKNFIEKLDKIDMNDIDMLLFDGEDDLQEVDEVIDASGYIISFEMMKKLIDDIQSKQTDASFNEFLSRYTNVFKMCSINMINKEHITTSIVKNV